MSHILDSGKTKLLTIMKKDKMVFFNSSTVRYLIIQSSINKSAELVSEIPNRAPRWRDYGYGLV